MRGFTRDMGLFARKKWGLRCCLDAQEDKKLQDLERKKTNVMSNVTF